METNGSLYRHVDGVLVRAVARAESVVPVWPDLTGSTPAHVQGWCEWLRNVWAVDAVAPAVEHASPALARQVEAMCAARLTDVRRARRTVLSVSKYLLRMNGRATPFGLFAGVAPARFGPDLIMGWGDSHRVVARADACWLAEMIGQLESCAQLRERLMVVANNACFVRGGRLVVPYQARPIGEHRSSIAVEVSIRHTSATRMAMAEAKAPIRCDELAEKLAAEFPAAAPCAASGLLVELVQARALISSLHAPSTVTDAFAHLMDQLDIAGAGEVPQAADLLSRLRTCLRS